MTRHLGVSVFLSVLIVVFFAVVLYQPEEGPGAPDSPAMGPAIPNAASDGAPLPAEEAPPETAPAEVASEPEPVAPPATPAARALPVSHRAPAPRTSVARVERTPPRPKPRPRPTGTTERLAFIEADAGESVEDVARRVYGSSESANALWLANRDILPDRAARLSSRTVLRTP